MISSDETKIDSFKDFVSKLSKHIDLDEGIEGPEKNGPKGSGDGIGL